jgi:hypothetical protein
VKGRPANAPRLILTRWVPQGRNDGMIEQWGTSSSSVRSVGRAGEALTGIEVLHSSIVPVRFVNKAPWVSGAAHRRSGIEQASLTLGWSRGCRRHDTRFS